MVRRAVHDVEPAGVAALAQVVEHLPADRPAGARRAHHCHRGRDEQPPRHRHGRRPAALGERRHGARRERCREPDELRPPLLAHLRGKAARLEHLDHAAVAPQHLRLEDLDPRGVRTLGEVGEQQRPKAVALELVGDRERGLRGGPAGRAGELGMADDPAGEAGDGDQAVDIRSVRLDEAARRLVRVAQPEEPIPVRERGEPSEELRHRVQVVGPHRSDGDGEPVAEHHVHLVSPIPNGHPRHPSRAPTARRAPRPYTLKRIWRTSPSWTT